MSRDLPPRPSLWPHPLAWTRSREAASLLPYALLTLAPLGVPAAGLLPAFRAGGLGGLYGQRVCYLLLKSSCLALLSALLAVLLGLGVAAWLVSGAGWARRLVRVLLPLPFLIPSCVYAEAWIGSFGLADVLPNLIRGIGGGSGFFGSVLILGMTSAPIPALLVLWTLESVPREYLEAALLLDEQRLWRDVLLPLAGPPARAAFGVSFALALVDYTVPSLMQLNVYSMEIHAEYSQSGDGSRALWIAFPLLALSALAVLASLLGIRSAPWRQEGVGGVSALGRLQPPVLVKFLAGLSALAVSAGAVLPTAAMVLQAAGRPAARGDLVSAAGDLVSSVAAGLGAAAIAVVVGWPAAWLLARRGSLGLWLVAALPLAVPGPLYGISLAALANVLLPRALQESGWILALGHAGRFLPIAVLVMASQFARLDGSALDAARLCAAGRIPAFLRIVVPLASGGLLAGAGVTFALSLGEVASTLVLVPPGSGILVLKLYNLLHYGAGGTVAVLALIQAGVVLATYAAIMAVLARRRA